jgi:SAM-dependent methyltransferase
VQTEPRIGPVAVRELRCPSSGGTLVEAGDALRSDDGQHEYPVVRGIPILLNGSSVFQVSTIARDDGSRPSLASRLKGIVRRLIPSPGGNLVAERNFERVAELLADGTSVKRVLVIGGAVLGDGLAAIMGLPHLEFVETDVYLGPRTQLVCDGHALPFVSGSFDAVICQAVLEHVVNPWIVADEIHRVLKPGGLVYSEVPFIQQVHLGALDFTRFTHSGHRLLFREFDEIDSGAVAGPGMALIWSMQYFLSAFTKSRSVQFVLQSIVAVLFFWLKYADAYLIRTPGGLDGASGTFFIGRRSETTTDERTIVESYRGAFRRAVF